MIPSYLGSKIQVPAEQVFGRGRNIIPSPDSSTTTSPPRDSHKYPSPPSVGKPSYGGAVSRPVSGSGRPSSKQKSAVPFVRSTPWNLDKGKRPIDVDGFTLVHNKRGPTKGKGRIFSSGYTSVNVFDALQPYVPIAPLPSGHDGTLEIVMDDGSDEAVPSTPSSLFMKVCSYNIQGLHNLDKLRTLWLWILQNDIDILCIQEHKLHSLAGKLQHCHGYTLFYGGRLGHYSGTMTFVKAKYMPIVAFNTDSGRALGVHISSEYGPLCISNIYGPNAASSHGALWASLASFPNLVGLVCGDFNMVEAKEHCASGASMMQLAERTKWELFHSTHLLTDVWNTQLPAKGYTYHSQAYNKAWAPLDRIYIVDTSWCPPLLEVNVDYSSHLSDHFPFIAYFCEYDWQSHMARCSIKRPLMVNNLHLGKSLFTAHVQLVMQFISVASVSATEKWITFTSCMQKVIRYCGKHYASITKKK